jgi:hypothetical protein
MSATAVSEVTLADKIYELIAADDGGFLSAIARALDAPGRELNEFERDVRDWSAAWGVAFGIARAEDPFEPFDSVLNRATEATKAAWKRYANRPPEPPPGRDVLLRKVIDAWEPARDLIGFPKTGNPRLDKALMDLDSAIFDADNAVGS